jgi:hypothetical protein
MDVSGQLHATAALPPGKSPPCTPLDRRLGGPQSRYGCCGEEKIRPRAGIRTPARRYTDCIEQLNFREQKQVTQSLLISANYKFKSIGTNSDGLSHFLR